jgi:hypoxanthine-guanine phosphoribosyltransferase
MRKKVDALAKELRNNLKSLLKISKGYMFMVCKLKGTIIYIAMLILLLFSKL